MSSISRPKICTNLLISAKSQFSTSSVTSKSHYDTLGVTSKATQTDIKSAYYKLTKIYHPDRNTSEEAKVKFRNITDAYEILGNYKSRKMYDRGMRPGPRHVESSSPEEKKKEDPQTRFYKSRLHRTQVQAPDGRTPIYNFDEWTKAHYGDLFDRSKRGKDNWIRIEKQREVKEIKKQNQAWIPIFLVFVILTTIVFPSYMDADLDKNKLTSDKKEP